MAGAGAESAAGRQGGLWLEAAVFAARQRVAGLWNGTRPRRALLSRPKVDGFAAFPHDPRPANPELGLAILNGAWKLGGETLTVGRGGDPWNRPSPSRPFAEDLHGFCWLKHLLATGDEGAREGLRLLAGWRSVFGRWNSFSWSGAVLERRVINLACGLGALTEKASEAEIEGFANLLARQARMLLQTSDPAWRKAERTVAAGVAAAALAGKPGDRLLARVAVRLDSLLPEVVLPDGGHISRAPQAGLELLLDLLALDDACVRRGVQTPDEALRAIDRLRASIRFFTLRDGALACFQGGESAPPALIAAARAAAEPDLIGEAPPPPSQARHVRYQRMSGRVLEVMVDAGPPAARPWSATATAQPAAIEIVCGKDRLVTNAGWSPRAPGAQPSRLTDSGSTVSLGNLSAGAPLAGWRARALGPLLVGGPRTVEVKRTAATGSGVWLDLAHDGWVERFGLTHERRLYLDLEADELRGEDLFTAVRPGRSRVIPFVAHFQLAPEVTAVLARDKQSVLLRGRSDKGWWLRNDANEVRIEPATHFQDGRRAPTLQVKLMGHVHTDKGGRVRWKLVAVE